MDMFDKKVVMSVFIAAIMILSTIGFVANYQTSESLKYNGHKFYKTQKGLMTRMDGKALYFNYFPKSLEDINVTEGISSILNNKESVSFTYNPNATHADAIAEMYFYLEQAFTGMKNAYVLQGLTNSTGYTLPEINCKDATEFVPVLIFEQSNETRITTENNCVKAYFATRTDVSRLGDRIVYSITGIMQ